MTCWRLLQSSCPLWLFLQSVTLTSLMKLPANMDFSRNKRKGGTDFCTSLSKNILPPNTSQNINNWIVSFCTVPILGGKKYCCFTLALLLRPAHYWKSFSARMRQTLGEKTSSTLT